MIAEGMPSAITFLKVSGCFSMLLPIRKLKLPHHIYVTALAQVTSGNGTIIKGEIDCFFWIINIPYKIVK
jgi:hypothetical protein